MILAKVAKKPFVMLPSEVFEQLKLNEGEEVELIIRHKKTRLFSPTVEEQFKDEDVDPELRALVGIDAPLALEEERKELRRAISQRFNALEDSG